MCMLTCQGHGYDKNLRVPGSSIFNLALERATRLSHQRTLSLLERLMTRELSPALLPAYTPLDLQMQNKPPGMTFNPIVLIK